MSTRYKIFQDPAGALYLIVFSQDGTPIDAVLGLEQADERAWNRLLRQIETHGAKKAAELWGEHIEDHGVSAKQLYDYILERPGVFRLICDNGTLYYGAMSRGVRYFFGLE
jgi:hypothetical protein